MTFRFTLSPRADRGQGVVGVTLAGPFAAASAAHGLPQLKVSYTRLAGKQSTTAQIVSTGSAAYVVSGGQTTQLSAAQAAPLRGALTTSGGLGGLGIDPSHWVRGAKLGGGPTLDGMKTDRITGELDASTALRDLAALAHRSGSAQVPDSEVKRLDDAISSSSVHVIAGHDDHLLRELVLKVSLRLPPELRSRVPAAGGIDATLLMRIDKPNTPVRVSAPATGG
ncbi:MAG: hypothetical protein QOC95_1218 [Thermoleophilaceae bacterium]|nr:hypothetical protein [Thermoleophilaceae bacterium]